MKISKKLSDYEIKCNEIDSISINEKINYTAKKYFYLINNYSKQILKFENEINLLCPNYPIRINELLYNQHFIIKELISVINKTSTKRIDNEPKENKNKNIFNDNKVESHIISFNIYPNKNPKNKFDIIEPSPTYKKTITTDSNNSNIINTSYSKSDIFKTMDKKIRNSLNKYDNDYSNYSLRSSNKYQVNNLIPMTEKIKKEISMRTKKNINNYNANYHGESLENLKYKLKYKYYKPSFLNSFVSGKKGNNKSHRNSNELTSTKCYTYKKNKNNISSSISNFNEMNLYECKKNGIKRVKSSYIETKKKMNNSFNIQFIDDLINNNFLDRTNSKSKPKANKNVHNFYLISNQIVDKFKKKIIE